MKDNFESNHRNGRFKTVRVNLNIEENKSRCLFFFAGAAIGAGAAAGGGGGGVFVNP